MAQSKHIPALPTTTSLSMRLGTLSTRLLIVLVGGTAVEANGCVLRFSFISTLTSSSSHQSIIAVCSTGEWKTHPQRAGGNT